MLPRTPLVAACDNSVAKTIINQGGTRSTKTWSALILFIKRSISNHDGQRLVIGRDVPFLKMGPIADIKRILAIYPGVKRYMPKSYYNQEDKQFNFSNGSFIKCSSFENEDDIKISDIDDALMNEANTVKFGYQIYRQLLMRTRGNVFLDYNPAAPFWAHDKLIGKPDVDTFYSDHRLNSYLPQYRHDEIEKQKLVDYEWWKVYGRGLTGNVTGIVYPRRKAIEKWPDDIDEIIWGIDYGYSVGATAILKTGIDRKNKTLYEKGCCYQPGLDEHQIFQVLKENGYVEGDPFYSEHDPDMINRLRGLGMVVCRADKGELSEYNAICKLRNWDVCYLFDENLNKEYQRCQFEVVYGSSTLDGSATEIITNRVKDTKNFHYMAAKRYSQYTHLFHE
jgi:phage terminase large subunit